MPVNIFMERLQAERSALFKLKLLSQFGTRPQEAEEFDRAISSRYGFISDYIGTNNGDTNIRYILQDVKNKSNINGYLIMEEGRVIIVTFENEKRVEASLTQEQKEAMSPILFEDVKKYYTQYFKNEAPQIDELIYTYSIIQNIPPEMALKTATLKFFLYTELRLFANGDKFFEQLGIKKEDIELVSQKAKVCLEKERGVADNSKPQHEYDLDFLYAIIQSDVFDIMVLRRQEYTEENLTKLMADVRANWQDAEFSNEEFKTLLNEILSRKLKNEDVRNSTIDAGIGIGEIDAVIGEIKKSQTRDKQKGIDIKLGFFI